MRIKTMLSRPLAISILGLALITAASGLAVAQSSGDASQFGPRAGKTSQPGAGQPTVEIIASHGPWKIQCETQVKSDKSDSQRQCGMVQTAQNEKNPKATLTLVLVNSKQGDKSQTTMRVIAPIGVFLPTGVALEIDGNAVGRVPFTRCMPQVCMAFAEASPETLTKMKKGNEANFIIYEAPGIGLPMKLSLDRILGSLGRSQQELGGRSALAEVLRVPYLDVSNAGTGDQRAKHIRQSRSLIPPISSRSRAEAIVADTLHGADDGELFVEKRQTESLVYDDGKLKSASFDESQGFGLRAVRGETAAYAHATDLSESALKRAAEVCRTVARGGGVNACQLAPERTNTRLYTDTNPVGSTGLSREDRAAAEGRCLCPRASIRVCARSRCRWLPTGRPSRSCAVTEAVYRDVRPLVRFNVSVVSSDGTEQGQGSHGLGGRGEPLTYFTEDIWQEAAREALRQSLVSLEAKPAPAGEMDVLLGPGWPGILLHEAVGHGLEGDFHRKKTSVFTGMLGERVAAKGVTIVDDGTIPEPPRLDQHRRRGNTIALARR